MLERISMLERITRKRIVPVVALNDAESAAPLAESLLAVMPPSEVEHALDWEEEEYFHRSDVFC